MPWGERTKMSERVKFIARLEEGESMSELCREFGISRKTGYKFLRRYREEGVTSLSDQKRRPYTCPHKTRIDVVELIVGLKKSKPHWGSPKIRELFRRRYPELKLPARSTIHSILVKAGFVDEGPKRRRLFAQPTTLKNAQNPNELWCIDFKGEFAMRNRSYCYPLTVSDHFSRFLIGIEAMESTKAEPVFHAFEEIFNEHGLPLRIRSDNGAPFASVGLCGLTRLSVWFLRLGIGLERIEPGHPEQNGRHERMHRTLKKQLSKEDNILVQQQFFESFKAEYNLERPHEALNMKTPAEVHRMSPRAMPKTLEELNYPAHDLTRKVYDGSVLLVNSKKKTKKFYLGTALTGENVGLKQAEDRLWRVDFMDMELGYYDEAEHKFLPTESRIK